MGIIKQTNKQTYSKQHSKSAAAFFETKSKKVWVLAMCLWNGFKSMVKQCCFYIWNHWMAAFKLHSSEQVLEITQRWHQWRKTHWFGFSRCLALKFTEQHIINEQNRKVNALETTDSSENISRNYCSSLLIIFDWNPRQICFDKKKYSI